MPPRTIVIVGGALAGPVAAARARETSEKARIILLERSPEANYSVGGIAQIVSGEAQTPRLTRRDKLEELADVWNVDVRTGVEVDALDVKRRAVKAGRERIPYDALVFAGGAASLMPAIDGLEGATNVSKFRTPQDADRILAARARGARRVAVIGGGSMGVEAADALARGGFEVVLLEKNARILPDFSPVMSDIAREGLAARGIHVMTRVRITDAERREDVVVALGLGPAKKLPVDFVVIAAGVAPRTTLLTDAGAKALRNGAVIVDEHCRTSLDHIFACGTSVARPGFLDDRPTWSAQAAVADRTAQVAGACAAGGDAQLHEPALDTMLVRAGDHAVGRTGLSRADAERVAGKAGLGVTIVEVDDVDSFVLEPSPVVIELRYQKKVGAVLGGEVGGARGVDKRLDALALGLRSGLLMVADLAEVDLGHTPAYAPVRDPLNVAGGVATSFIAGDAVSVLAETLGSARVTLVDVRDGADGPMAAGARSVPLRRLRDELKTLPASRPIVFLCDTGRMAYIATRIARGRGRKDATFVAGGLRAWRAAGLPLADDKT